MIFVNHINKFLVFIKFRKMNKIISDKIKTNDFRSFLFRFWCINKITWTADSRAIEIISIIKIIVQRCIYEVRRTCLPLG
jgi:hypothetical protein